MYHRLFCCFPGRSFRCPSCAGRQHPPVRDRGIPAPSRQPAGLGRSPPHERIGTHLRQRQSLYQDRHLGFLQTGGTGQKRHGAAALCQHVLEPFSLREDITNWGKADYWVWPNLFLKKSGDCEDYAIVKYFTLKELGIDTDKLRIVVLRDTLRRLSHAVLAVYMDNDIVILDNISNAILPQGRLRHYVPQFSFNEKARWAHMRGKKTNE